MCHNRTMHPAVPVVCSRLDMDGIPCTFSSPCFATCSGWNVSTECQSSQTADLPSNVTYQDTGCVAPTQSQPSTSNRTTANAEVLLPYSLAFGYTILPQAMPVRLANAPFGFRCLHSPLFHCAFHLCVFSASRPRQFALRRTCDATSTAQTMTWTGPVLGARVKSGDILQVVLCVNDPSAQPVCASTTVAIGEWVRSRCAHASSAVSDVSKSQDIRATTVPLCVLFLRPIQMTPLLRVGG